MKLLLYGFGPYDNHESNISAELVESLRLPSNVQREVFEVRFDRGMFVEAVDSHDPDLILGLGQSARSRRIRIERKALNRMGERGEAKRSISRRGPEHLFMTLGIPHDGRARLSYDAGTYVCNFSMYVLAEHCMQRGKQIGFIHLPKCCDRVVAASFVCDTIAACVKETPRVHRTPRVF
jgi:pyrrolidone-carboxylate peptidase